MIVLNTRKHTITANGKPVHLTPKEKKLILILAEANGDVVSRDTILERIWGIEERLNVDTRTVDQHAARLRVKFGKAGECIKTVVGYGYKVEGGVQIVGTSDLKPLRGTVSGVSFGPKKETHIMLTVPGFLTIKKGDKIPVPA